MLFFPYAPDVNLFRFPILTLAVCLACVTVTYFQYADDRHVTRTIDRFCSEKAPRSFQLALWKIQEPEWKSCPYLMHSLYWSRDREGLIARIARLTPDPARAAGVLSERYGRLARLVPRSLTERLAYAPESWHPGRMLTAVFAHGGWTHLAGNLFFFFAFAAAVESILGPVLFTGVFLILGFGTGLAYSLANLGISDPIPTVGLSGVVFGMMGLLVAFAPHLSIRCFLWVVVFFKRFALPAWLLFAWFLGWDAYYLFTAEDERPGVNLVAHVGGGVIGLIGGVLMRLQGLRLEP